MLAGQIQFRHNLRRRSTLVQRVEVKPRHTFTQKFLALTRGVLDAKLRDCLLVIPAFVQLAHQGRRQIGAAQGDKALDL